MKRSHILTLAIAGFFLTAASPQHQTRLHANLIGFHEVPANSTVASGDFTAEISSDETTIHYKLTYSGLEGTVTQAHIHFGQRFVAAGISLWLCQVPGVTTDPAGLAPTCPQEASSNNPVEGNLTFKIWLDQPDRALMVHPIPALPRNLPRSSRLSAQA